MKYTFASLGKLESFGFRIGGAGLGNILFPWARAIVYAKEHNLIRVQTTWRGLKFGTFIRSERDKRLYFDLFTGRDGVSGIRKFLLLNFSNSVKVFSGMNNLFEPFQHQHTFVRSELLKIVNPFHIKKANIFPVDSVAIHIRMGDFRIPKNENILRQGGWNYRLPGDDGVLGKTSINLINDENPFGLDPQDPNSKDDILVMDADLHLEINQPVKIELRSLDVLHNFYIPQFRAKMDTLPGIITYYWFTPEKTGEFEILCAEYCGTGHYAMRGFVKVDDEKDYSNWLAKQISYEKMLAKNGKEKLLIAESKN